MQKLDDTACKGKQKVIVLFACTDYRMNQMLDEIIDGAKKNGNEVHVFRTEGSAVHNAIPSIKRIVEKAKQEGNEIEIHALPHTECKAMAFVFNMLRDNKRTDQLIEDKCIDFYRGTNTNDIHAFCNENRELLQRVLEYNFGEDKSVKISVQLVDMKDLRMYPDPPENRLIISRTNDRFTYRDINNIKGYGRSAYYLHADSLHDLMAGIKIAHEELKIVDIRLLSMERTDEVSLQEEMLELTKLAWAKDSVITYERAYRTEEAASEAAKMIMRLGI